MSEKTHSKLAPADAAYMFNLIMSPASIFRITT